MKYDFKQPLKNFDGSPILSGTVTPETLSRVIGALDPDARLKILQALEAEKVRPLTLELVCCTALANDLPEDRDARGVVTVGADERMRRFRLGLLLVCPGEDGCVEVSDEQRDMLKKLLPRAWGGSVVPMQAVTMLGGT